MATANPFDLLGDNDNDDPSLLIAAAQKIAAKKPLPPPPTATATATAKLPSKPLPPAQAVREAKEVRGGGGPTRGGGSSRGRAGRGVAQNWDSGNNSFDGSFTVHRGGSGGGGGGDDGGRAQQDRERPPREPYAGGRRGGYGGGGGYGNGEDGGDLERLPRRAYERRSGTGRGHEMKRDGAGRRNWGTATDEPITQEKEEGDGKVIYPVKEPALEEMPTAESVKDKEGTANEPQEKEDNEMTLEEYEKIKEEKRKALQALKNEERKVEIDKDLQSMQQLSLKKGDDDAFFKVGSDKDTGKKKEAADRDEKNKKPVRITEFLKPSEGEKYYNPGGRGRGRGRGPYRGGYGERGSIVTTAAPSIEDPGQFPTLGGK